MRRRTLKNAESGSVSGMTDKPRPNAGNAQQTGKLLQLGQGKQWTLPDPWKETFRQGVQNSGSAEQKHLFTGVFAYSKFRDERNRKTYNSVMKYAKK